jgi:hypothetical protein
MILTRPWRPLVAEPALAADTRRVACEVLARLRDPDDFAAAAVAAPANGAGWRPGSVAQGHCGPALACGYFDRCFQGEGWDVSAHEHLTRAVQGTEAQPMHAAGLFAGLSGVAFTAGYLSHDGTRYRRLLQHLDEDALEMVADELGRDTGSGVAVGAFDVISGWAGITAYLVTREGTRVAPLTRQVVRRLVELTHEADGLPGWHTPGPLIVDRAMAQRHPGGVHNCGMAHGVTGLLAALCLAHRHGVDVPGLEDAVRRSAHWLAAQKADGGFPAVVPLDAAQRVAPARDAWCYGGPGVAVALRQAGELLGDPELRTLATASIAEVLRRPVAARRIDGPGFCHGEAGLLQIVLRLAQDEPALRPGAGELTQRLLARYDPGTRLGYRSVEPGGVEADRPGLLEGSTAIAMVLLASVSAVPPDWDRLFLLS